MAPVIELQFWGKWAGDTWGPYAKHSMAINCSGLSCFLHCLSQIAFDSKPNYTQGVRTRSYLNTPAYTLSPDLARLTYVCMYGWINNEKHILHMESERYTFKLFSVCNCQSRLYSRTKLVWYFAGYLCGGFVEVVLEWSSQSVSVQRLKSCEEIDKWLFKWQFPYWDGGNTVESDG